VKLETMQEAVEELQTELLRRIATRDCGALGEFYDQTARPLFSLACQMLGNAGEAEEVIQDVFVQIWTKAGAFDAAKGRPFHWALSITRNRSIDRLRARQRRSRVMVDLDGDQALEQMAEPPADEASLMNEDATEIRSAVDGLPQDQRQAIKMAFFGGMTHQEIAETLSEPLGTIKARIRRGMLKLREVLRNYL
jgi:RNA polymerase sigma-70 factor (ECF subfamily)